MTHLFRRLRYLLNRSHFDQELADDLDFHREMAARSGHATIRDTVRVREDARAAWGWTWIDRLAQDLRYAARMLWRSPGFTLTAIVMLAIGIGANIAGCGFLNLIVLRQLPIHDPDTLLRFERRAPQQVATDLPYSEVAFFAAHATALSAVLASSSVRITLKGADNPAAHGYAAGSAQAYLETLRARLAALPGVRSVALATTPPLGGRKSIIRPEAATRPVDIYTNRVDPGFLATMKIPILRGRNLQAGDTQAVVVSESMALGQWPGEDPLGKSFGGQTVVGIAGNARWVALQDPDAVEAYFLASADDAATRVALVSTSGAAEAVVPVVAAAARAIDPKIFPDVRLLKTAYAGKLREAEIGAASVAVLGVCALLLACLGIVGLVAYSVSQCAKEIGIRMALGASGSHVLTVVLGQLSRPVVAGLLLGVVGAAALSQVLRRQLYGVSNLDPVAYLAAIGVFVLTAVLTALVPARRALRVDPLTALRHE